MKSNFNRCLDFIVIKEGGFVNHPADPGGATNMGLTIKTMRRLGIDLDGDGDVDVDDVRLVNRAVVARVFREHYWNPVAGDRLPSGLDLVAADAAYHSGVSRGAKWLQAALKVDADGFIGPETLAAAKEAHKINTINRACILRRLFLRSLPTWPTFGKGWQRRVDSVRETALDMAVELPLIQRLWFKLRGLM